MTGFRPDTTRFPQLLMQGLSKREIAARASDPDHIRLVRTAYDVHPTKMANMSAVYFVAPEDNEVCKIGFAVNPFERIRGIQTGCWLELSIKALFWYPHINNAQSHEYAALAYAKKHGLRLKGEWVDLEWQEAIGLALTASGDDRRFTDSCGLIQDWFPELHRQFVEYDDALYALKPKAA